MRSVQLLESIVRRIFYRFWKTFLKVIVFLVFSMMEPDSIAVHNFIPGVHSVSTIRVICEDPTSSIDPPDHLEISRGLDRFFHSKVLEKCLERVSRKF